MQLTPYRLICSVAFALLLLLFSSSFFLSCSKDPQAVPPGISLIQGEGYISHDTAMAPGTKVRVGIHALAGNASLTYFSVRFNDGTSKILLDTGMNSPSLLYNLDVIKTNAQVEKWTFFVMDRNRREDSVMISFGKSEISQWGRIRTVNDVVLGAQENSAAGSFYSLDNELVMNLEEAYVNQSLVDMVYYYGQYEGTLASPNEAEAPGFFTGPHGIVNWTVKNEMRYDTTMILPAVFDASTNDSLILTAYEPTAGKKKGKFIQQGLVFSFRSPDGKLGLIKIIETSPLPSGYVKLSVKIQE